MYIAMKTYQKIPAFTGWTALKLKSVICIVPDRQKRKSEKKSSHIQKEFQLVVFDHHTDMQKPMIEHMTSCGDWAEKVLETNPWLQQLILIGPQAKDIEQLYREKDGLMNRKEISEKLLTFSAEEIHTGEDKNKISKMKKNLPVYISIDKDILDKQYTETNWSQGNMSLPMLERWLSHFLENGNILALISAENASREFHCLNICRLKN